MIMDVYDQFIGRWELLEWTANQANSEVVYPYGADAVGQLWYDATGNMMVEIMKKERKYFASNNFLQGTAEEILSAYSGFVAYGGRYTINPIAKQVIHHIKISSFPNWVGQDQLRYYEFNHDLLLLSTPVMDSIRHQLIWQKIQSLSSTKA
jgi:hypothetical protein